jgi:hypothetical protein
MWKTSFPPDVVVSITSLIRLETNLAAVEGGDRFDEVLERPAEAVQAPDNKGVAGSHVAQGFVEPFTFGFGSGCGVGEDLGTACLLEGVVLKIKGLV